MQMIQIPRLHLLVGLVVLVAGSQSRVLALSTLNPADLLSQEQYASQARRSEEERVFMLRNGVPPSELLEPDFSSIKKQSSPSISKNKNTNSNNDKSSKNGKAVARGGGGGGFGGSSTTRWSKTKALAKLQKEHLLENGVLRINNALSPECCSALRAHIQKERTEAMALYEESRQDPSIEFVQENYFGIEPGRSCRTDLLLSFQPEPVSNALEELFNSSKGKLRDLYESLVTKEGIMYELAGVVTSPGSDRQCVHPDLPFQSTAPLMVTFVALQDVTTCMGPTTFVLGSNTQAAREAYENTQAMNELLSSADICESTMSAGDLVVFDARTLHCGNANVGTNDRALFNFSFRNPTIKGELGYVGSMRPQYTAQQTSLGDILAKIDEKPKGSHGSSLFEDYGNGWN